MHRFMQNNPKMDPSLYGRWWAITLKEFPNSYQTVSEKSIKNAVTKEATVTETQIVKKLKEIRQKLTTTRPLEDELRECKIKKHISNGLSYTFHD